MNYLPEAEQISLYYKIISGEPVDNCFIEAFLCRPHQLKPKTEYEFVQYKEQLLDLRFKNQKKDLLSRSTFNYICKNDHFQKYALSQGLAEDEPEYLDRLTIDRGTIPCIYRSALWPKVANVELVGNAEDFFIYLCTPAFLKHVEYNNIIGLKRSCDGGEEDNSCRNTSLQNATHEFGRAPALNNAYESNAISFVMYNNIILNDIDRTLSQTQLFSYNQPLFPVICQLVCCVIVRYNRYVQGMSVCCGICLLYCKNKEDALSLLFKLTQCTVYQQFLHMNVESLNIYSQSIYKMMKSILAYKTIYQRLFRKELKLTMQQLDENVFPVMCASLTGLILSYFGKAGPELASQCVDYLCFCRGYSINIRLIVLCISFYVVKICSADDVDGLLGALTKQLRFNYHELLMFREVVRIIIGNMYWVQGQLSYMMEILKFAKFE